MFISSFLLYTSLIVHRTNALMAFACVPPFLAMGLKYEMFSSLWVHLVGGVGGNLGVIVYGCASRHFETYPIHIPGL